jgi:predicted negative regulator of RcsB-dependent stress response
MKKQSQSGFAVVELVVVVVVLVALGGVGYYVWHSHKATNNTTATTTTSSSYQSPTTSVPAAPQVNNASDLNSAMQALDQTNVTAGNTDSSQLSTQASAF